MNKNLQMVYTYHNETKHSAQKYAKSLGYMDWETQPNPYRYYENSEQTVLPLSFDNVTLPYKEIFNEKKSEIAPFCIESISQFFQFSLGLAAIKKAGDQSWDLRCNASSGNLQPTEAYIICDGIDSINNGLHHYNVENHNLELLCSNKSKLTIPNNSFLISLTSIIWREAWKYGERSWRYTQLDCGHALRALEISAFMLGWEIELVNTSEDELNDLLGLNQENRYMKEELENSDMLFIISKKTVSNNINIQELRNCFEKEYNGKANHLSESWHKWDILKQIDIACKKEKKEISEEKRIFNNHRNDTYESKDIVLNRRSAQRMDINNSKITFNEFEILIASVSSSLNRDKPSVNLVLFIHNVEGLDSGIYILVRNIFHKHSLMSQFKDEFLWQDINLNEGKLYLLRKGDYKVLSKTISCNQDIASHGAFSIGMLAQFDEQLIAYDAHRYKELYWECGAIGQQLYLEATSLNLSATGIGCYLDDLFHGVLGLENSSFQSLYHFTIGRSILDNRLTTLKPYDNR